MGDRAAKDALFSEFAAVGKVLASPKRLELLDLLAQGPRTVEDLPAAAGLGRPPAGPPAAAAGRRARHVPS